MLDIAPETNEVIDEIRRSVAALCEKFPGEYWREQDRERAYPTEFVKALTDAGFLAVLVPEEYGGSGLPISAAAAVLEESTNPDVMEGLAMPRCTLWELYSDTEAQSRSRSSFQRSRQVNLDCRHLAFLNPPAEPIRYL